MQTAKLENWSVVGLGTPYTAPEAFVQVLRGEVYGHPDFTDGEKVTSSALTLLEGGIAKTKNTEYDLGFPECEYAAWCIRHGYNIYKGY